MRGLPSWTDAGPLAKIKRRAAIVASCSSLLGMKKRAHVDGEIMHESARVFRRAFFFSPYAGKVQGG
jgi:hypothetical protein